ncbi:MAG TPA: LysM peptidoglycan-binding domain-containing protein [Bacillota bacterium]|nr:LysM peptidoglycan-binding domain-containing protein [Bacillota bacterium]
MIIYTIRPGDTLYQIALRYGVSLSELLSINQLPNPNQLVIGQAILIPGPSTSPLRYTVAPGDTLFELAETFGTTVNALIQANNITDPNLIRPGMVLIIPGWTQQIYTIQPGDSLYSIANRFSVSLDLLIKVNHISNPNQIYPGQRIIIPQKLPVKKTIETLGYFQSTNVSGLTQSLNEVGAYITYGALFQFPINSAGEITVPTTTANVVNLFKSFNIRPLMVITNWGPNGFEPDLARAIIGNESVKAGTIANVLRLMDQFGFGGVNVDFENMYATDRPLYTTFIRDLASALKPHGYLLTVAIPPKTADLPTQSWVGAFDYAALGQLADIIFLMTYEWGWIGGPPSPISPINQVRRTLDYAVTQIPPEKIIQGAPFYGYNWPLPHTPENPAVPVNLVEVYDLAYRNQANINYDSTAQSPWFDYTDAQNMGHEVWFEDARSMDAKYKTTQDYNLRGVGWWSYVNSPYGFPQNWVVLTDIFNIRKNP